MALPLLSIVLICCLLSAVFVISCHCFLAFVRSNDFLLRSFNEQDVGYQGYVSDGQGENTYVRYGADDQESTVPENEQHHHSQHGTPAPPRQNANPHSNHDTSVHHHDTSVHHYDTSVHHHDTGNHFDTSGFHADAGHH